MVLLPNRSACYAISRSAPLLIVLELLASLRLAISWLVNYMAIALMMG